MRHTVFEQLMQDAQSGKVWDFIVIGGGATGLGSAVDASARGFSVLLLESNDFAKGTSSRSTKLVHGGVRYLAQGNIPLVKEALAERGFLARNASHLVKTLSFVIPAYRWWQIPFYGIGLFLYDWLAGRLGLGRTRILLRKRVLDALPTVMPFRLKGGVQYTDGQFDDARLAISLMRTLSTLGGVAINYCPVESLLREGPANAPRVCGVVAKDAVTGHRLELRARSVINATGVWADKIRLMDHAQARTMIKPSQGVHLVVGRNFFPTDHGLLIPRTDDGRVLFVLPWHGHTLLGTTDTPRSDAPLEPQAMHEEIEFILGNAARYLSKAPSRADVLSVFVGLRPLVDPGDEASNTASISREHTIEVSSSGLVTITGGKWTTYRAMAEEVIDKAIQVSKQAQRGCNTRDLLLHGAQPVRAESRAGAAIASVYGSDAKSIERLPGADRPVHRLFPDLTVAHVRFFVRCEMAQTVEDVLARRHRMLFLNARAAAESAQIVAEVMADELGRDERWVRDQVIQFKDLAANYCLA